MKNTKQIKITSAQVERANDIAQRAEFAQREFLRDAMATCQAKNADATLCERATMAYQTARDVAMRAKQEAHDLAQAFAAQSRRA
jgi:hypothetical protein